MPKDLAKVSEMDKEEKARLKNKLTNDMEKRRKDKLAKMGWEVASKKAKVSDTADELVTSMTETRQEQNRIKKVAKQKLKQQELKEQSEKNLKRALDAKRLREQLDKNKQLQEKPKPTHTQPTITSPDTTMDAAVGSILATPSMKHQMADYFRAEHTKTQPIANYQPQSNTWRENTGYNMPKPNMPPSNIQRQKPSVIMYSAYAVEVFLKFVV